MDETNRCIDQYIDHPGQMDAEAIGKLRQLVEQYPYCATYRMLYVLALGNVHSVKMADELKKTAVYLPDRFKLFALMNNGEHEWMTLLDQVQTQRHRQNDLQNDFLLIDRYLDQLHLPETAATPIYDATDALTKLQDLSDATIGDDDSDADGSDGVSPTETGDEQDALIDNFIEAEKHGTLFVPPSLPSEEDDDSVFPTTGKVHESAFLTESLAKIYIKQHKYEQALAIIRDLNLKYPKKNVYFADQIRFLEKIITYKTK